MIVALKFLLLLLLHMRSHRASTAERVAKKQQFLTATGAGNDLAPLPDRGRMRKLTAMRKSRRQRDRMSSVVSWFSTKFSFAIAVICGCEVILWSFPLMWAIAPSNDPVLLSANEHLRGYLQEQTENLERLSVYQAQQKENEDELPVRLADTTVTPAPSGLDTLSLHAGEHGMFPYDEDGSTRPPLRNLKDFLLAVGVASGAALATTRGPSRKRRRTEHGWVPSGQGTHGGSSCCGAGARSSHSGTATCHLNAAPSLLLLLLVSGVGVQQGASMAAAASPSMPSAAAAASTSTPVDSSSTPTSRFAATDSNGGTDAKPLIVVGDAGGTATDVASELLADRQQRQLLVSLLQRIASRDVATIEECGLRCWLGNLTLHIPGQRFTAAGETLQVMDITCTRILLGGLDSQFVPPTALQFGASGVGISCTANWTLSGLLSSSGYITAQASDSSVTLGMELVKDQDGLASEAKLTDCSASIDISALHFYGGFSSEILELFHSQIASFLSSELDSVICAELRTLIDTNLTAALRQVDALIRPYMHPVPPVLPPMVPKGSAILMGHPLVGVVDYVLNTVIGADSPIVGANALVDRFTNGTGTIELGGLSEWLTLAVPVAIPGVANATVVVGVNNVTAAGLDTWADIDLAVPISNYTLASYTLLERLALNLTFFVNVTVSPVASPPSPSAAPVTLYEEALLVMDMTHNALNSTVQLALRNALLKKLQPYEMLQSQCALTECLIAVVDQINITEVVFNITLNRLSLVALSGSIEKDLDAALDNILLLFTTSFGPAIPAFMNGVVGTLGRSELNRLAAETFEAPNKTHDCSATVNHHYIDEIGFDMQSSVGAYAGAAGLFAVLLAGTVAAHVYFTMQRRRRRWRGSSSPAAPQHSEDYARSSRWERLKRALNRRSTWDCLAMNERIPWAVRAVVLLLIPATMATFIASNTSVGASVYALVTVGDTQLDLPAFFDFSLGGTVKDMWNAGVYPLSLLIAIFSGGWPYLKLLVLLVCWLAPTRLLRPKWREWFLMVVDALGKWSLIDAYVLTLMMVAFYVRIESPEDAQSHTQKGAVEVEVVVKPMFGFHTFLVATILSLVLTHVVLALHRFVTNYSRRHEIAELERALPSISLGATRFRVGREHVRCTPLGRLLIALLLAASLALVAVGSAIDSFQFEFRGLAAVALAYLHYDVERGHSTISLGEDIPSCSGAPDSFAIRWIQATFFLFVLVVPLLHLLSLLVLWLVPLRPALQRYLFVACEVFNAWSALEVFVLSIIAALLEIEQFAQFLIGDRCDLIDRILKTYFADLGVTECFDVIATLRWGCWILFAACLIYLLAGFVVMRLCHKVLEERDDLARRHAIAARRARKVSLPYAGDAPLHGNSEDKRDHHGNGLSLNLPPSDYASAEESYSPRNGPAADRPESEEDDSLLGPQLPQRQTDEEGESGEEEEELVKDSRCGPALRAVFIWLRLLQLDSRSDYEMLRPVNA